MFRLSLFTSSGIPKPSYRSTYTVPNTMVIYPDSDKGYTHLSKEVACADSSPAWARLSLTTVITDAIAAQLLLGDTINARSSGSKALQQRLRDLRRIGLPCNLATANAAW
jgi:hypothetical protein